MKSETPACDKHKYETDQGAEVVPLGIAERLERSANEWQNIASELIDQCDELKQENIALHEQVEQMKNCCNCRHGGYGSLCRLPGDDDCNADRSKWEAKT